MVTFDPIDGLWWACELEDAEVLPPQGPERTKFVEECFEHDNGCMYDHAPTDSCITYDDVQEMKFQARDYEGWAAL